MRLPARLLTGGWPLRCRMWLRGGCRCHQSCQTSVRVIDTLWRRCDAGSCRLGFDLAVSRTRRNRSRLQRQSRRG